MKQLLIAEMQRAIELLEKSEKPFEYSHSNPGEGAELKRLMMNVRKHSILLEKKNTRYY